MTVQLPATFRSVVYDSIALPAPLWHHTYSVYSKSMLSFRHVWSLSEACESFHSTCCILFVTFACFLTPGDVELTPLKLKIQTAEC